ncbi:MAG: hypothetical protein KKA16_00455 [Alphaproteobacteria bacterium]|nr:hypothetical protein [Alphaproteobacteria bacterium]MBU2379356.1 hypothetical protein [Alphaproteobacteria bacterium]
MLSGARGWVTILGGLIVWAVHMLGIYAIFSWIDLAPENDGPGRAGAALFSLLCALGALGLSWFSFHDRRSNAEMRAVGGYGALVATVAIVFQTAPILLS